MTGAALYKTFAPAEECSEKFCMRVLRLLTSVCAPPLATVSRTSFNVMLAVVPLKQNPVVMSISRRGTFEVVID